MKKTSFPYHKVNFLLSVIGFVGSLGFYYGVLHKVYSDDSIEQQKKIEELKRENKELHKQLNKSHSVNAVITD